MDPLQASTHKGFKSTTGMIAGIVVVVLVIAGANWIIKNKPLSQVSSTPSTSDVDMKGWQTYRNEALGFEFRYPSDNFKVIKDTGWIRVYHAIPFRHIIPCVEGGPKLGMILDDYHDVEVFLQIKNLSLEDTLREEYGGLKGWVINENGSINEDSEEHHFVELENGQRAYFVRSGAEMCGSEVHYISLDDRHTLMVLDLFDDMLITDSRSEDGSISLRDAIQKYGVQNSAMVIENIISSVKLLN